MHCHGGDRGFAHSDDLDDVTGHLPVLRNTPQLTSQVPKLISLFPMKFAIYPFQGVGGGLGLGSLGKVEGFGLDRAGSVALAAHRLAAASSSVVSAAVQSNVVRSRLSPGRDKDHARAELARSAGALLVEKRQHAPARCVAKGVKGPIERIGVLWPGGVVTLTGCGGAK